MIGPPNVMPEEQQWATNLWQTNLWQANLWEARRLAAEQNKPIFMRSMNGKPFGSV
jgi:hypothetical protein